MNTIIVIGDSFNNTLGLIRSIGETGRGVILLLVGDDRLYVKKSRYIRKTFHCECLDCCWDILLELSRTYKDSFLICSNDKAAKWVDERERELSSFFKTPMRGNSLGILFDKPEQCELAKEFGITIPLSFNYKRGEFFSQSVGFPVLLKPSNSNSGEKSDIHICQNIKDVNEALNLSSVCQDFICQEYIEKDFEINLIGVSTDNGVVIPGGIKKIRHYPTIYSPCSYGRFLPAAMLDIDIGPVAAMVESVGYRGPFSVEFLRKGNKSYFMEVNFRHDGLAYAATASGVNLLRMYLEGSPSKYKVSPIYMMDLSIDYCHVKDKNISHWHWIKDFIKTGCQLNFNWRDPMPTISYYLHKISKF